MQKKLSNNVDGSASLTGKILLIEDEELIRELYSDALRFAGFDLVLVENGEKGLEKWQQEEFSLLITDIGLPGISGWEVIESIRQQDERVPIIIVSGWGNQVELARSEKLKVNHFLSKPIDLFSLTSIIKKCLQQPGQKITASN